MKLLLFIIVIFFNINLFAQNIWEKTHFSENGIPLSIEIPDSNHCFILVDMSNNDKLIFKSTNQGKEWFQVSSEYIEIRDFDISCPDSSNIFLSFTYGTIYKSHNAGQNFEIIKINTDDMFDINFISMINRDTGVVSKNSILITRDSWKTYEKFAIYEENMFFSYRNPIFINDSVIYANVYEGLNNAPPGMYFLKLNINSKEYELNHIDNIYEGIRDLCVVNENLLFVCGKSNTISGGSGNDAIYKSTDAGKSWRRVLDLYSDKSKFPGVFQPPFGLQQIAFKDSITGIAVGQFGKILYTYDGGESWIYENDLPPYLGGGESNPATMEIRYAGRVPIIAAFNGTFHRMSKDNLAPKPEDIYSISGRVWEGTKGQSGIPVALGYRITMTDSDGYYTFTLLKKGNYTVKALNKYFDGGNPLYDYKPFDYKPLQYDIELMSDTTGFDFNAVDLRTYYSVSGNIRNSKGESLSGIKIKIAGDTTITDSEGRYIFYNVESKIDYVKPLDYSYKFKPQFYYQKIIGNIDTLNFIAEPTTSVWESTENSGILITPNPAGDYIIIQPSEGFEISESYKVQLFDLLGIEIISESIHPMTASYRMNIEHLPAGVYFIKIGNKVEKFMKI